MTLRSPHLLSNIPACFLAVRYAPLPHPLSSNCLLFLPRTLTKDFLDVGCFFFKRSLGYMDDRRSSFILDCITYMLSCCRDVAVRMVVSCPLNLLLKAGEGEIQVRFNINRLVLQRRHARWNTATLGRIRSRVLVRFLLHILRSPLDLLRPVLPRIFRFVGSPTEPARPGRLCLLHLLFGVVASVSQSVGGRGFVVIQLSLSILAVPSYRRPCVLANLRYPGSRVIFCRPSILARPLELLFPRCLYQKAGMSIA